MASPQCVSTDVYDTSYAKALSLWQHWYGFSPVCVFISLIRSLFYLKAFSHRQDDCISFLWKNHSVRKPSYNRYRMLIIFTWNDFTIYKLDYALTYFKNALCIYNFWQILLFIIIIMILYNYFSNHCGLNTLH